MTIWVKCCTNQFCNLNIPPGIWTFEFLAVKFQFPSSKKLFKCPTCKTRWMGKCPTPGTYFYRQTGQRFKTICYKYQLAFLILKMDKGTSFLHLKASLSSYDSYLVVSHSATNAISYLLNRLTISRRSCLAIVCERGNSPPSTAWCQILHPPAVLRSNYLLPGIGRVSNARGMAPGGMLRLQIDRYISSRIKPLSFHTIHTEIVCTIYHKMTS